MIEDQEKVKLHTIIDYQLTGLTATKRFQNNILKFKVKYLYLRLNDEFVTVYVPGQIQQLIDFFIRIKPADNYLLPDDLACLKERIGATYDPNVPRIKVYRTSKATCPHCGMEGSASTMTRYHFDNCKKKV